MRGISINIERKKERFLEEFMKKLQELKEANIIDFKEDKKEDLKNILKETLTEAMNLKEKSLYEKRELALKTLSKLLEKGIIVIKGETNEEIIDNRDRFLDELKVIIIKFIAYKE